MTKYMLAFYNQRGPSNPVGGGIDPILEFIDSREDVFTDWVILFRQIILVTSEADATKITKLLRRQFPHILFLVAAITEHNGWLPPEVWKFLTEESEP